MACFIIGTNKIIKYFVILNIVNLLDNDVMIEVFSHLSVGVKVAGGQIIPPRSFLKVGTSVGHES